MLIKKYQNKNEKMPKAFNKWYGRVVHLGTIDTDGLAKHIMSHGSVYSDDIVLGVVRKMMHCIVELLLKGHKVTLDGIGTFYIAVTTSGAENAEEFDLRTNLKSVHVRFTACQAADSLYSKNGLQRIRVSSNMDSFQEE